MTAVFNLEPLVLGKTRNLGEERVPSESPGDGSPQWVLGAKGGGLGTKFPHKQKPFVNECIKFRCSRNKNVYR